MGKKSESAEVAPVAEPAEATASEALVSIKALVDLNTSKFGSTKKGGVLKVSKAFADQIIKIGEAELAEE